MPHPYDLLLTSRLYHDHLLSPNPNPNPTMPCQLSLPYEYGVPNPTTITPSLLAPHV